MNVPEGPLPAEQALGGWSRIGPGGVHQGRLIGIKPLGHLITDVGSPLLAAHLARRKRSKDYNDAPTDDVVGDDQGQVVKGGGEPSWLPAP